MESKEQMNEKEQCLPHALRVFLFFFVFLSVSFSFFFFGGGVIALREKGIRRRVLWVTYAGWKNLDTRDREGM